MRHLALGLLALAGCRAPLAAPVANAHPPAATVDHPVAETDLPVVHLSPETVARLGIETTTVTAGAVARTRLVGGEVVVPPGRTVTVTAPVAGEVRLARPDLAPGVAVHRDDLLLRLTPIAPTDRDTRARVAREVAAAEANLAALAQRVRRSEALLAERAGSARALEEAVAARDVARADVKVARARAAALAHEPLLADVALRVLAPADGVVRLLTIADGQSVSNGVPLLEIVPVDALQVRVPVYGGDLGRLATTVPAQVSRLGQPSGGQATTVAAVFVPGPPTAEPDRGTVDRYLALPDDAGFAPGERVQVMLTLTEAEDVRTVPTAAVVLDAWGGAWVYRCDADRFTRARVDPLRRVGDRTVLAHGPPVGACVVGVGAGEVFGTEFPPGH